jgi:hypothetical protein
MRSLFLDTLISWTRGRTGRWNLPYNSRRKRSIDEVNFQARLLAGGNKRWDPHGRRQGLHSDRHRHWLTVSPSVSASTPQLTPPVPHHPFADCSRHVHELFRPLPPSNPKFASRPTRTVPLRKNGSCFRITTSRMDRNVLIATGGFWKGSVGKEFYHRDVHQKVSTSSLCFFFFVTHPNLYLVASNPAFHLHPTTIIYLRNHQGPLQ